MTRGVDYSLEDFLQTDDDQILGVLTASVASTGVQSTRTTQIDSWKQEIQILKRTARDLIDKSSSTTTWHLILEYGLPRRQKRPDAVLLAGDVILVIEFKVRATSFDASARWQTEDYCLNLRDFHAASAGHPIIPILCATLAPGTAHSTEWVVDSVAPIQYANERNLSDIILCAQRFVSRPGTDTLDPQDWIKSPYRPTLSVIEAAERLYGNHGVRGSTPILRTLQRSPIMGNKECFHVEEKKVQPGVQTGCR